MSIRGLTVCSQKICPAGNHITGQMFNDHRNTIGPVIQNGKKPFVINLLHRYLNLAFECMKAIPNLIQKALYLLIIQIFQLTNSSIYLYVLGRAVHPIKHECAQESNAADHNRLSKAGRPLYRPLPDNAHFRLWPGRHFGSLRWSDHRTGRGPGRK